VSSQHTNLSETRTTPSSGRNTKRERYPGRWLPRGLRRIGLVGAVVLVSSAIGAVATNYLIASQIVNSVGRISGVFDGLDPATRPTADPAAAKGETILAIGSDLSGSDSDSAPAGSHMLLPHQLTDVIMLIRFDRLRGTLSVVSLPRDSWVEVPDFGKMKLHAAYPLGGPPLLIRTVEQLTQLRIDHFMVIDFAKFQSTVRLATDQAPADPDSRTGLPEEDLARIRSQQHVLRAVLAGLAQDPMQKPLQVYRLLEATTQAVAVDEAYQPDKLRELGMEAARLPEDRIWFLIAPVKETGWENDQNVVHLDGERASALWQALRSDTLADYVAQHPAELLSATP